jgi:archaemetzincin
MAVVIAAMPPRPGPLSRRAVLRLASAFGWTGVWARRRLARAATPLADEPLQIQPLGPVPNAALALVERALASTFAFRLERLPVNAMPPEAYYLPRKRYRAELVMAALSKQTPARIIGVTALDISTTKGAHADWGILGLGDIGGRACVISSFRCNKRAASAGAAAIRLAKVAVHEVGHTLGLQHCPTVGCLMEDASGSVLTVDRETELCAACRDRLAAAGFTVRRPAFRWAAP